MRSVWNSLRTYGLAAAPNFVALLVSLLGILGMLGQLEPLVVIALIVLLQCLGFSLSALRPYQDIDRHDRASVAICTACTVAAAMSLALLGRLHFDWLPPVAAVIMIICCACQYAIIKRSARNAKASMSQQSAV